MTSKTYTVHGHFRRRDGRLEAFWTRTGLSKSAAQKLAREQRREEGGVARVVAEDETFSRGHARKKSPSRLDREIAEVLSGSRGRHLNHAARKTSPRPSPYRIKLTPSELGAVEFARGRYAWPDMLAAHAAEDGSIAFTESEMWQWTDDVDSDAEGGHSPFPLASDAFAEKLQRFYDERV